MRNYFKCKDMCLTFSTNIVQFIPDKEMTGSSEIKVMISPAFS